MPAQQGFLAANLDNQRPIHAENGDCRSAGGGEAENMDFAPTEMFAPVIPPWGKKRDAASGFRIDRVCLCSLSQGA
jgi:hypothetical protein